MGADGFEVIAEVDGSGGSGPGMRVYEHGWQSWSPAGLYDADVISGPRPQRPEWQTMAFRPGRPAPPIGFQGEGLLAVVPPAGDGEVRTWLAADPSVAVASIRAHLRSGRLVIEADGPVVELPPAPSLEGALAATGDHLAALMGPREIRSLAPGWCSWYGYGPDISDAVVTTNLGVIERERLDVRLVQIDDGHQSDIGDWLAGSGRIRSMVDLAGRIRDGGREAGVWIAPFMIGDNSRVARNHPDWLVRDAVAATHHWGQTIRVLDITHPGAAAYLLDVFGTMRTWGFTFFKLDFLYAGAMEGGRHVDLDPITVYRTGLRMIRDAIGVDATILGCGAPLLPSIGMVDAMRVSPDTDHALDPVAGDISQPSQRSALAAGRARTWMHGRLWNNDPDCLIASTRNEHREGWAAYVDGYGGLAMSGDALDQLDRRGLDLTRSALRPSRSAPVA